MISSQRLTFNPSPDCKARSDLWAVGTPHLINQTHRVPQLILAGAGKTTTITARSARIGECKIFDKSWDESRYCVAVRGYERQDINIQTVITENYKVNIPFEFNGIIQELNLKVVPVRFCGTSYGSYNLLNKNIKLASPDIEVFFHELSHAADDRLNGLKVGQKKDQEVMAEFRAAVIGYLMGYKIPLGNVKEYIENYSFKELLNSLSRIEKVVTFMIDRTRMNTAAVNIPRQAAACTG